MPRKKAGSVPKTTKKTTKPAKRAPKAKTAPKKVVDKVVEVVDDIENPFIDIDDIPDTIDTIFGEPKEQQALLGIQFRVLYDNKEVLSKLEWYIDIDSYTWVRLCRRERAIIDDIRHKKGRIAIRKHWKVRIGYPNSKPLSCTIVDDEDDWNSYAKLANTLKKSKELVVMSVDAIYFRKEVDSSPLASPAQNLSNKRTRSDTGLTEDDAEDNISPLNTPKKLRVSIMLFRVLTFEVY
jgi:hypothetical protein